MNDDELGPFEEASEADEERVLFGDLERILERDPQNVSALINTAALILNKQGESVDDQIADQRTEGADALPFFLFAQGGWEDAQTYIERIPGCDLASAEFWSSLIDKVDEVILSFAWSFLIYTAFMRFPDDPVIQEKFFEMVFQEGLIDTAERLLVSEAASTMPAHIRSKNMAFLSMAKGEEAEVLRHAEEMQTNANAFYENSADDDPEETRDSFIAYSLRKIGQKLAVGARKLGEDNRRDHGIRFLQAAESIFDMVGEYPDNSGGLHKTIAEKHIGGAKRALGLEGDGGNPGGHSPTGFG